LDGSIQKRNKKLSKRVYGTSHTISREEVRFIYAKRAELLIVGMGYYGRVELSDGARRYLKKHGCRAKLQATPAAILTWNSTG
jgi:hypothetical protein